MISVLDVPAAGLLSWVLPGLGHLYVGERVRGWILLVTMTVTFWTGVAVGGVRGTVDIKGHTGWFMAQICSGGHTGAALALRWATGPGEGETQAAQLNAHPRRGESPPTFYGHFASIDIGIVYTAVAGLLNVLIILDAIVRADHASREPEPRPTYAAGGGG